MENKTVKEQMQQIFEHPDITLVSKTLIEEYCGNMCLTAIKEWQDIFFDCCAGEFALKIYSLLCDMKYKADDKFKEKYQWKTK